MVRRGVGHTHDLAKHRHLLSPRDLASDRKSTCHTDDNDGGERCGGSPGDQRPGGECSCERQAAQQHERRIRELDVAGRGWQRNVVRETPGTEVQVEPRHYCPEQDHHICLARPQRKSGRRP